MRPAGFIYFFTTPGRAHSYNSERSSIVQMIIFLILAGDSKHWSAALLAEVAVLLTHDSQGDISHSKLPPVNFAGRLSGVRGGSCGPAEAGGENQKVDQLAAGVLPDLTGGGRAVAQSKPGPGRVHQQLRPPLSEGVRAPV